MRVTRADVARLARVSPAVVSYVINSGPRPVAADTRQRVLAAVQELGYRPDVVARSLRSGPTRSIGLIIPDLTNPFFAEMSRAVEAIAFEEGYVLLVGSSEADSERELRYVRSFLDRRVDALIMVSSAAPDALETAGRSGIPVVTLDRVPPGSRASSVVADGDEGVREAVAHLRRLGHREIGMVGGPEGLTVADQRVRAWLDALEDADISADRLLVREPFTRAGGAAGARRLLDTAAPTALIASSDVQAVGALGECGRRGLAVPEDLSIIAFDGTDLAEYAQPPLTVIEQPIQEMATVAMEFALRADSAEPEHRVLPPRLVVRASTAPPAGAGGAHAGGARADGARAGGVAVPPSDADSHPRRSSR